VETLNGNQRCSISAASGRIGLWPVRACRLLGDGDGGTRPHRADLSAGAGALIYVALPALSLIVFQLASQVQSEAGIAGLAGLACSGFLPLSISFAGGEFPRLSAVMAGGLIAFYQLGYGVAAFGIGPLQGLFGLSFSTIFAAGSVVAAPIIIIAWLVIRPTRNTRAAPER
jgi:MFS family permease